MVRDTSSRRCGKAVEVAALAVVLAFDQGTYIIRRGAPFCGAFLLGRPGRLGVPAPAPTDPMSANSVLDAGRQHRAWSPAKVLLSMGKAGESLPESHAHANTSSDASRRQDAT